jgi:hypothetical protein
MIKALHKLMVYVVVHPPQDRVGERVTGIVRDRPSVRRKALS